MCRKLFFRAEIGDLNSGYEWITLRAMAFGIDRKATSVMLNSIPRRTPDQTESTALFSYALLNVGRYIAGLGRAI